MGMDKCKACGRDFASTNPNDEICYPCKNALKRLNGYAVPVVRCKDCKSFVPFVEPYHKAGQCNRKMIGLVGEEDFCSYGERKDNERKAD